MQKRFAAAAAMAMLGAQTFAAAQPATSRPNVLLILADDLGYSDLGCFGGEISTPNLDSLAKNGVRFTQFYNGARCCPTRASLLTGLYAHQTGLGHMMFDRDLPGYRGDLNKQCVTIGEVLSGSGYRTYAIGKWHLTRFDKPNLSNHNWPLQRGFEKYYGLIWGYSSFFDPAIVRGNQWYSCENDPEYKSDNFYFTNALSDNAVSFLQEHSKQTANEPFFMYLAFTAAHWPMHALEQDIAKYKGKFDAGYDKLRKQRLDRIRKLGILKTSFALTPTAEKWEDVPNKEWELRCMEVYAAMIECMDRGIGQVIAELKRQNKLDNTLIMFLQDNGACAEDRGRKAPREPYPENLRPLKPDELPASTIPAQTRDGRPIKTGTDVMPGGPDSYIAYGQGWANVSNTPFREYKHWVHEGGIATPLIAHWPAGIPQSRKNKFVEDPAHIIDIMATCVDVAGAAYPTEHNGEKIPPMEGVSLVPAFKGKKLLRKEPLFWEHEENRAVREGRWKLVAKGGQPWELYDMERDRTEMQNVAAEHAALVQQLSEKWDVWAKRCNVLPLGGWREKEKKENKVPSKLTKTRFRAGAKLSTAATPQVADSPITVTVQLLKPVGDGVLVAHGAKLNGYALYVSNGKAEFAVRREGKLKKVVARESVGDSPTTLTAILGGKGRAYILKDEKSISERVQVGLLSKTPVDPVSAGNDFGDPVGDYPPDFPYKGELGEIIIETR